MNASPGATDAAAPDDPRPGDVLAGRYRLTRELARGGMGRVFVAWDPKLQRDVAIKLATSSEVRAVREGRALASLNHANILAIFDAGESAGHHYLVCELLEGKTLRERAAGSALPPSEALDVAIEMARGLRAAHERKIVHRDLKPENVFVTQGGAVKLLDFGIAKVVDAPAFETTLTADATTRATTPAATAQGGVVGTPGYMAPEQVRGEPLGLPADLFSFGAVLYELLAGRRAFQARGFEATCAAILTQQPPPLPPGVPHAVRRIVERCLEKDPAQRFQDATELFAELESARGALLRRSRRRQWRIAAAVLLVVAAGATIAVWRARNRVTGALSILPVTAQQGGAGAAASIEGALRRALGFAQELPAARQWTLRSGISPSGSRLRFVADFESGGRKVGQRLEAVGSAEEIEKDADDLAGRLREQFGLLWRDHLRRQRAHTLAHASAAEEKLLAYYDLMGRSPRIEFLDRGRKLLDDALAADPRYVPALAERSALLRLAANREGEDRQAILRLSRADADAALAVAPRDPQALLAECLTARLQMKNWPSDRELETATAACSDATQADPESVQAPYTLAMLYDQGCQIGQLIETLKLALDRARRFEVGQVRTVTFYLVSVALQRHHLQEADAFSAELLIAEAREDRLRALAPAAAAPPMQGAHFIRAAALTKLERFDEAGTELEVELTRGASAIGGLDEHVEAATLHGLSRIEGLRGKTLDRSRAARLAALDEQFAAADARSSGVSGIAGWYAFIDPEFAARWLERRSVASSCPVAIQRANIFRDAGHSDRAAQALAECNPSEEWAKRCVRFIASELPAAAK